MRKTGCAYETFDFNLRPLTAGTFDTREGEDREVFWTSFSTGTLDMEAGGLSDYQSFGDWDGWVRVVVTEYDRCVARNGGDVRGRPRRACYIRRARPRTGDDARA